MGNSEIGHMTMGAGRTIPTDLVRISNAIHTGEFNLIPAFIKLFEHVQKYDSTIHILGLLSPIGVHSHQDHLHAFLHLAKKTGIKKIVIHAFTDGRDSPPQESFLYVQELEKTLADLGIGHIGTVTGRYYAMDRDKNWNRTQLAADAIFSGKGKKYQQRKTSEVLQELHTDGALDEYFEPLIFLDENGKNYGIEKNDGIFFFNFRTDRPRQLCYRILERAKGDNLFLTTLTQYAPDITAAVAFPPTKLTHTLAEILSGNGFSQVHIAETEKYAHVTYFFNGEQPQLLPHEQHVLIESRKDIKTHDAAPEMRAREIADAAIEHIHTGTNFLVINFANADIVGHTANKTAIVTAVETVDTELGRIISALKISGGVAFVTADHGNAEVNIDAATGQKHTSHTVNQVPAIITKKDVVLHSGGTLADIAPTILQLYGIEIPKEMTGKVLFD